MYLLSTSDNSTLATSFYTPARGSSSSNRLGDSFRLESGDEIEFEEGFHVEIGDFESKSRTVSVRVASAIRPRALIKMVGLVIVIESCGIERGHSKVESDRITICSNLGGFVRFADVSSCCSIPRCERCDSIAAKIEWIDRIGERKGDCDRERCLQRIRNRPAKVLCHRDRGPGGESE